MANENFESQRSTARPIATGLIAFPCLLLLVFALHFPRLGSFFHFRLRYVPASPDRVVRALIAWHDQGPLVHDPHMVGLLVLPLLVVCALAIFLLGWRARPVLSAVAAMMTVAGTVYMGGVMAMWVAFYHGIGALEAKDAAGAAVTFAAMSTGRAAVAITWLARLGILGLGAQALTLIGTHVVPLWASACVAVGCGIFLLFWDLDNWMAIGTALMLCGFVRMAVTVRRLRLEAPVVE